MSMGEMAQGQRRHTHHVQVSMVPAGLKVGDQRRDVDNDVVVDLEVEVGLEFAGELAEQLHGLRRQIRIGVGGVEAQDVAELRRLCLNRPLCRVI